MGALDSTRQISRALAQTSCLRGHSGQDLVSHQVSERGGFRSVLAEVAAAVWLLRDHEWGKRVHQESVLNLYVGVGGVTQTMHGNWER